MSHHPPSRWHGLCLAAVLGWTVVTSTGCGDTDVDATPAVSAGANRLPAEEARALTALSRRPVAAASDVAEQDGPGHHDASVFERPPPPEPLTPHRQALFDEQWAAATSAAERLDTTEAALQAGYRQAAPTVAGVGAHWIKWSLVDEPFDPAAPSMLLFDTVTTGRPPMLVGLSYWVVSDGAPDGFAGPNDVWHRHHGMCFENGWLTAQQTGRTECGGAWVDGRDLWMLHAWTVSDLPNAWGPFASINPRLCPPPTEVPDWLSCNPAGT